MCVPSIIIHHNLLSSLLVVLGNIKFSAGDYCISHVMWLLHIEIWSHNYVALIHNMVTENGLQTINFWQKAN